MVSVYDVDATELINEISKEIRAVIHQPEWTLYVKTGVHKERTPTNPEWWYFRVASILRRVYLMGPIGTEKLRRFYGGLKNRGHKPERFYRGSGSVVRKSLQMLEKAGFISKVDTPKKGRVLTPKGKSFVDKIAAKLVAINQAQQIEAEKAKAQ